MKKNLLKKTAGWLLGLGAALGLLAACANPIGQSPTAAVPAAQSRVANLPGGFRIVGYSASWRGTAQEIDYDKLTHIIYAFAIPDTQGNIISLENSAKLQSIISLGHAKGVKVSLAVGGWSYNNVELDATFEQLAANATARANLKNKLIGLVDQYGLDGIDMDWEYPDAGTASADNYTALMTELSAALKAKGKLLSAAVCASGWAGNAVSASVMNAVDFLNIMAYDGDAGAGHSPMSYATGALDFWIAQRGLPAAKANLGVPFYARPSWRAYDELVPLAPSVVPFTDFYNGDYYNGIPTIKEKTKLAKQRAGGIMIWELSHDTTDATSLLSAIYAQVVDTPVDTQAPTTPGNLSASGITSSGAALSWTASSDNVGVTAYVVSGAGATQTITGTSATLSGLSASTSYTVRVIAKDAAGNASPAATVNFTTTSDTDPVLATGVPGTPNLQQDNWDGAPNFGINMNMWWGNNGTKFELFENGILVATVTLKDNSPNAQTTSVKFTGKAKGTYKYLGKLTNKFGTTSSGELSYTVR